MNQKTMMKTKMIKLSRKRIKKMKMMRRSSLILKEGFHKLQQRLTHKRTKLHQLTKIQITMLHQKKLKFHQVLLIQKRSILLRKRSLQLLVAWNNLRSKIWELDTMKVLKKIKYGLPIVSLISHRIHHHYKSINNNRKCKHLCWNLIWCQR